MVREPREDIHAIMILNPGPVLCVAWFDGLLLAAHEILFSRLLTFTRQLGFVLVISFLGMDLRKRGSKLCFTKSKFK